MGTLSEYVYNGIQYYINEMNKEEARAHGQSEDSGLVWASHVAKCPKKSALRRATESAEDFDFDKVLTMLIGRVLGELVARAMIRTGEETGVTVNVEEVIKTEYLSGRIDVSLLDKQAGIDAAVEVKYTSFFYPGFNIDYLAQLCSYMYAKNLSTGVLVVIYKTGGMKVFEVLKQRDAYYVYKGSGEAISISYDTTLPLDEYGNVCLTEQALITMIEERKDWINYAFEDPENALNIVGPFMNITKISFECAQAKYPEKYLTDRGPGKRIGDPKKQGTIKCNCPFFDSCYNGWIKDSDRMVEGHMYEFDGHAIGQEIEDAN